ncbi:leucine--tRNA ligase, partial [Campylobacter vulpis]|nr:leucine--tRNA ligase [Campylobacter vulpis]
PHICFELSEKLFHFENFKKLELKPEVFVKDSLNLGVSVNGKKRAEIEVNASLSQDEIIWLAKEKVAKWLEGKSVIKEIYVPNSLVNLVVK